MAYFPRLDKVVQVFAITRTRNDEGDQVTSTESPQKAFAEVTYRMTRATDDLAPRQVAQVQIVVRTQSAGIDFQRPQDYQVQVAGVMYEINSAYPHELKGYSVCVLKNLR